MRGKTGPAFVFLLVMICGALCVWGQDTASIAGTVTDETGAVVTGATVTLTSATTGATYQGVTNSVGFYTISNVAPGPNYSATVERQGFERVILSGLYLNINATRTQNVTLKVGATSQSVEVKAAGQDVTLNTVDATVGNNFQVQFMQELPVEIRDTPAALFTFQPGITATSVTGARTDQSNVTLDGLEVNDAATGEFGAISGGAAVDSVQEFRGTVAGMLSSSGQGGGGQFELVTRSGTNQFHGNINEYHRDTALTANTWANNDTTPITPRPPLIRNQFGGNIGGPILKDKLFFFFNYDGRIDTVSSLVTRSVPTDTFRAGTLAYHNSSGTTSVLSSQQVAGFDPQGIGFSQPLLSLFQQRYPVANDTTGNVGDLLTTAGFHFNAPAPFNEKNFVTRVDYALNSAHKLFGRFTIMRINATESPIQFPGDPPTHPFFDKTWAWVVGDTWTISNNKVNSFSYGITNQNYNFPTTYNPQGTSQFIFGGNGSGGNIMSGAYSSAINAQGRIFPIPVFRDDFTWIKGRHNMTFGGTFKYENPYDYTILDYNSPTIGLGGHLSGLNASLRPSNVSPTSANLTRYDEALTLALGHVSQVSSTFNYNAQGNLLPQGTGSNAHYRFYETEVYFGDSWKVTPELTIAYGVRWQNYSVPYEKNGIESVPTLDFNQLFGARISQSAAMNTDPTGVPFVQYVLGGKANNGPGYFEPVYKNFAPRLAFAWNPGFSKKTVWSGGAGIIYDHTVVNAVQYQAAQYSYLFQASATTAYGNNGDPVGSLLNDPRFAGISNPPTPPTAPAALKAPYTPFVDFSGPTPNPFGLANGSAFNEGVDKNLKTPYNINFNFGVQHEFPRGFLLQTMYVGRLGRRLLGQADANQLIDYKDGVSGQFMGTAFSNMITQVRVTPPDQNGIVPMTVQPWMENVILPGAYQFFDPDPTQCPALGGPSNPACPFTSNTSLVANGLAPYSYRGDFADMIEALAGIGILPYNVGMGSQFSEFTYYTNKGFSSYNGLLVTLHKNMGYGLQFDMNYTWSHSIDNVSVVANAPAIGGYGFICDVLRPRNCRGNSDFDLQNVFNANFIWTLPVGRGREFGHDIPRWADEIVGGWSTSGIPTWSSGGAYFATSNAFVAGYANDAPAILVGAPGLVKYHLHKNPDGSLTAFDNVNAALNAYTGPVGFDIGGRNNLRAGSAFTFDAGLGKVFPIWERLRMQFRADAFNVLNHPTFGAPNNDITQANSAFGYVPPPTTQRILQLALRLEF
jgi:Carboxypeptidase regulatory-like domain